MKIGKLTTAVSFPKDEVTINPAPTGGFIASGVTSSTGVMDGVLISLGRPEPTKSGNVLQKAVFSHIRAIRALGRTQINSGEIAEALGISIQDVNEAVKRLRDKGVRAL